MDSLRGRSMLRLKSFTDGEMMNLIDLAAQLKARRASGVRGDLLRRRNIALIFEKSSTRTRNSCVVAARDEGGGVEYLTRPDIHFGKKESVKDTARVLGRIYDGILFRGFSQKVCEELAEYSGVPVWNGLTDDYHPTQIFADLLTVKETFGSLEDCTVAYVGDGRNNVANSLMMGCAKCGVRYVCCCPAELSPDAAVLAEASEVAARNGVDIRVFNDPAEGVRGANVLYTDVWVSMGEESKTAERIKLLRPYQINMALMEATGNLGGRLMFLHCLPAFHDANTEVTKECGALEVTDEVFESKYSKVFDEAENRMHTIKALFVSALCDRAAV
ncbi:MAG: ornithine carbamoyltransferase [Kiritimatiellae bacterium]|nr:ornithine carbamoyltransferase [Kiritimatiellia bacterium]